ncbi:MAG: Putative transmembrane protein [uncultured Blastococcus sp.]|uniref:Transmembrane protein n=1 Tax=uncultured Blastococcus sp. TaxID=217144 RepID=A0A6J4JBR9_9ACTN|nr:MAG: Putative transmembrane protein [uncultured Blastococcus sp.]
MQLYAHSPTQRTRQLAADAGMLAWLVLWVLVARIVHGAVLVLAEPGRAVEDLGRSVAGSMESAAGAAEDVPVVGDELAAPFDALSDAGGSVSGAGQATQDAVGTLATVLAVVLVVLPVGWLLLRWLPWRLRWAREASAARSLLSGTPDLHVLAARALATAPLPRLAALPPGTGAAWQAGDPAAVRALAGLELARLGLRLPD